MNESALVSITIMVTSGFRQRATDNVTLVLLCQLDLLVFHRLKLHRQMHPGGEPV